jgi:hypothetical protein
MLKKAFLALSLLVGIGIFIFVIGQFGGFAKTIEAVGHVGWLGVAIFVAVSSLTLAAPGVGWWILMRGEGLKVTLWSTLKANFMGFPINFIAPSFFLGSEPLKMFYLSHVHGEAKRRILASIIVSKFQEVGGLLFVMLVAAGIAVWKLDFSRGQEILIIGALIFLLVGFAFLLYAFLGNFRPTVKVIQLLARVRKWRRRMARLRTRAEEMEQLVRGAFTKRWKTFLAAQAFTLLSAVGILMRPWIYFYFSQEGRLLGGEYLCAIYVVTNLINILPHTPGGLGIFDGGMVGLFALLDLGKSNAAAFALLTRTADVVLILLGLWLIVHYNLQSMARRVAKGEEKVSVGDAEREEPTSP